jgi:hypothetical protein
MAKADSTHASELKPKQWFFDRPDEFYYFSDMQDAGMKRDEVERFRRIHNGLLCIQTLADIQRGFITEDCMERKSAMRLSDTGKDRLACAISLFAGYLADDAIKLACDEEKRGASQ